MSHTTTRPIEFVNWLNTLSARADRGALAALRRGLMYDEAQLFLLFGHIPPGFLAGLKPWEEMIYLRVAALYAFHPCRFNVGDGDEGTSKRNFGASLRLLAQRKSEPLKEADDSRDVVPDSLKRRVEALLNAPSSDVFGHLRHLVSLLKSEDIPIDWAILLKHLRAWSHPDRWVQWEWSRLFYIGYENKGGEVDG